MGLLHGVIAVLWRKTNAEKTHKKRAPEEKLGDTLIDKTKTNEKEDSHMNDVVVEKSISVATLLVSHA